MGSERDKLITIEIDDFTEYVQLSKARRAKPYVQGKCRLPKKYSNPNEYAWVKKGRLMVLIRVADGLLMTANPKAAGTPKMVKVNGQDIYNGNISRQARASLVKAIHNYVSPHLNPISPFIDIEKFPLTLELLFYIHDKGKNNIDNDNKWLWRKGIQDTLTELGKIVDDNVQIISRNEEETILIPEDQQQKLIINIYGSKNS